MPPAVWAAFLFAQVLASSPARHDPLLPRTFPPLFSLAEDVEDEGRRHREGERAQGSENLHRLAGDGGDDQSAEDRIGEVAQRAENQVALKPCVPYTWDGLFALN